MSKKKIIVFIIVVLVVAIAWPKKKLKIASINDDATIELSNGATVKLIGVSITQDGIDYLNGFKGQPVDLTPDKVAAFEQRNVKRGDVVRAYVNVNNYALCLNSAMLQQGKAGMVEDGFLKDSLYVYRQYAASAKSVPAPERKGMNYAEDQLVLPEYTPTSGRRYTFWCMNTNDLAMLNEACDYNKQYTREFAVQLAGRAQAKTGGQSPFCIEQVCEIFEYCHNNWKYVNDPKGSEYLASASESIHCGLNGDCDDFAVLMASCILAVGGDATVVLGQSPEGGHAWAEVDINGFANSDPAYIKSYIEQNFSPITVDEIHIRHDGQHQWLNLDWQRPYPGGPWFSNNCYYYSCVNGNWMMSR